MKDTLQIASGRIQWIDCAKGITILLVIIGHTALVSNNLIRSTIFSFHMPLFFLLSAMTYRCSRNRSEFLSKTKRAFRHLILPMVFVWTLRLAIDLITV